MSSVDDATSPDSQIRQSLKSIGSGGVADTLMSLLDQSNIINLLVFLAIYLLITFIITVFSSSDTASQRLLMVSRVFDLVVMLALVSIAILWYIGKTETGRQESAKATIKNYIEFVDSVSSIFVMGLFILVFYLLIFLMGMPMDSGSKPVSVTLLESGAWITVALIVIAAFFDKFMNMSASAIINNMVAPAPSPGPSPGPSTGPGHDGPIKPDGDEVFNIGTQAFTYEDAQSVCTSYGARLATYDEVEDAYNKGGEWCNHGWSDGQMILFPTQKGTWDKLQKGKNKSACGRPGVNGGMMENPYSRFGANCFGVKPKPSDDALAKLAEAAASGDAMPMTEEDRILAMKAKYWKEHGGDILKINAFNGKSWSEL
jgi:hypothetical protein